MLRTGRGLSSLLTACSGGIRGWESCSDAVDIIHVSDRKLLTYRSGVGTRGGGRVEEGEMTEVESGDSAMTRMGKEAWDRETSHQSF